MKLSLVTRFIISYIVFAILGLAAVLLCQYKFISENEPFIHTDEMIFCIYFLYFKNKTGQLPVDYRMAKKYCKYKLNKARFEGRDVIWETVTAKEDKLIELQYFKKTGYRIVVFFITNDDIGKLATSTSR